MVRCSHAMKKWEMGLCWPVLVILARNEGLHKTTIFHWGKLLLELTSGLVLGERSKFRSIVRKITTWRWKSSNECGGGNTAKVNFDLTAAVLHTTNIYDMV